MMNLIIELLYTASAAREGRRIRNAEREGTWKDCETRYHDNDDDNAMTMNGWTSMQAWMDWQDKTRQTFVLYDYD